MLAINQDGTLVVLSNSKKEIPVLGVIFMDNIYAAKCWDFATSGREVDKDKLLDDTLKFAIQ
jgi:hypothetical protein